MYRKYPAFHSILSFMLISVGCAKSQTEINRAFFKEIKTTREEVTKDFYEERKRSIHSPIHAPFLWRVEKNGKTSWLLGTIHIGVSFGEFPITIHRKLAAAKTVVTESDCGRTFRNRMKLAMNKEPKGSRSKVSLKQTIGTDAWQVLRQRLGPMMLPELDRFSPSEAYGYYLMVRMAAVLQDSAYLDCEIQKESERSGPWQVYLDEHPKVDIDALLLALGAEASAGDPKFDGPKFRSILLEKPDEPLRNWLSEKYEMVSRYKKGELDKIDFFPENSEIYQTLIRSRNEIWMHPLKTVFTAGEAFVAVGVGHMIGEASLVTMLRNEGFTVSRATH